MSGRFTFSPRGRRLALKEASIGDRLPYAGHVDPVTLRTRDGLLMQIVKLRGLPFETKSDDELNYRKNLREVLLRGAASSRLAVYHHVIRRNVTVNLCSRFDDPFCGKLNELWREHLHKRQLFHNDLFLTFVCRPLQGEVGRLDRIWRGASSWAIERDVQDLHAARDSFLATLAPYGPETLSTYAFNGGVASRPAEFLSAIANAEHRPVLAPTGDMGHALATRRLNFGLDALEYVSVGGEPSVFGAILSLKDYPARSSPGMLDALLRLPCELVLTESFAFLDRQVSLDRMKLSLRRLRAADNDAFSLRSDLAQARDDVGAGRAAYGEHHLSVLIKGSTLAEVDSALAEARAAMAECGAVAVLEDVNLEPAFWAQFPGNFKFIARRAMVSVANFASLASLHSHPRGGASFHWGEPVTTLETTGFGPYDFSFHNGDLGNFTVIGPSGSGKTVLLSFLAAQASKFQPRLVFFDKDRGAEIFIRAAGGRYGRLVPGEPSGLNPLQLDDTAENRAFLGQWLERLLLDGAPLGAEDRAVLVDAIDASYDQPAGDRRLRHLRELLAGVRRPSAGDMAARLAAWCDGGEHAWLFDNAADRLDLDADRLGLDLTAVLDHPAVRTPAMMYLFHRVEQRVDGRPTIIIVDEGWKALDDPVFVARLRDWQKTIRKRNGLVGFCTQSAGDALESSISSAIIEQAATQIFFPNERARAEDYIRGFGLTEHEFQLVRSLPDTARCFLVKQAGASVVVRLDLTGLEPYVRVLAANERDVRRMDELRSRLGASPDAWLPTFLGEAQEAAP